MAWPGFELAPSESPIMESTLTSATQPLNSRLFYSKVRFISPFTVKPCFSLKSVPLNSCYTETNQQ